MMTNAIDPYDAQTTLMNLSPDSEPFFSGSGKWSPLIGPDGKPVVQRWCWLWPVPLWEFRNGRPALTFHDRDGATYQPDNHFATDFMSSPPPMWSIPFLRLAPMNYPRMSALHDCGFKYGGLYRRLPGKAHHHFALLEREFLDGLARRMVKADGGTKFNAGTVRAGLGIGSRWAWDEQAQAAAREQDGISLH